MRGKHGKATHWYHIKSCNTDVLRHSQKQKSKSMSCNSVKVILTIYV